MIIKVKIVFIYGRRSRVDRKSSMGFKTLWGISRRRLSVCPSPFLCTTVGISARLSLLCFDNCWEIVDSQNYFFLIGNNDVALYIAKSLTPVYIRDGVGKPTSHKPLYDSPLPIWCHCVALFHLVTRCYKYMA